MRVLPAFIFIIVGIPISIMISMRDPRIFCTITIALAFCCCLAVCLGALIGAFEQWVDTYLRRYYRNILKTSGHNIVDP